MTTLVLPLSNMYPTDVQSDTSDWEQSQTDFYDWGWDNFPEEELKESKQLCQVSDRGTFLIN